MPGLTRRLTQHLNHTTMSKYKVKIVETLVKVVDVEAPSKVEAKLKARESWTKCEEVLSADDFCDVEFYVID